MGVLAVQSEVATPQDRLGIAVLTRYAFAGKNPDEIASRLLVASSQGENQSGAMMDLAVIEQIKGNTELGLEQQRNALVHNNLYRTVGSKGRKLKLLVLAAPIHMGGNTPVELLLENADVEILTVYIAPGLPIPENLPHHDLVMIVAPGDTGSIHEIMPGLQPSDYLEEIRSFLDGVTLPVINRADPIFALERDNLPGHLAGIDGVRTPHCVRCSLDTLAALVLEESPVGDGESEIAFPLIIRPVGSHAGYGLELLRTAKGLQAYLKHYQHPEYFISQAIDYSSEDGQFRKYRIMFVNGEAYPCHMAIADQWKLWYMNAGMDQCARKRLEEAAFMTNFRDGFGKQFSAQLTQIAERIGLDYFGIDCAVDKDGNLVIFEADNAMIAHDMDPVDLYPYKAPAMRKIFRAFEQMLFARAQSGNAIVPRASENRWVRIG